MIKSAVQSASLTAAIIFAGQGLINSQERSPIVDWPAWVCALVSGICIGVFISTMGYKNDL